VQHSAEIYIGLMSGTSLDGIDAALVDLGHAQPRLLATHYLSFDNTLKNNLLDLHQPVHNELHQMQMVANQLAHLYAEAAKQLVASSDLTVRAIGCHGQTIRHCPEHGYTLQIGNAALLAELTNIPVVSDFRSRDIAAGGQGAPLVPAFHHNVMRHPNIHRVIVNIGGISNLTNLSPDADTSGFDCGPGNLLMDAWCVQHLCQPYDDNGVWAASGKVLPALLTQLLNEPFFALPPPKSTGRDLFNIAWLRSKLCGTERVEDVQATLLELTCLSIKQGINQYCMGATEIYLCGGGAHNKALRNRLIALLPACKIQTTDALGVAGDFLEAVTFAWLAQQALHGIPINLTKVTGARHPCILGAIYGNA